MGYRLGLRDGEPRWSRVATHPPVEEPSPNNQWPASFAALTSTSTARVREPRRQL
jgi:hypothetical protein